MGQTSEGEPSHEAVDVTHISLDHFAIGRTFLFAGVLLQSIYLELSVKGMFLDKIDATIPNPPNRLL
jgi:hypothetical protein